MQVADERQREKLLSDFRGISRLFPDLPIVLFLDTLSRCAVGLDENSHQDMTRLVWGGDQLRERGVTVITAHHSVKGGTVERGHSSLKASLDAQFRVTRSGSQIQVINEKDKEFKTGGRLVFTPEIVTVDNTHSTCVMRWAGEGAAPEKSPQRGPNPTTRLSGGAEGALRVLVAAGATGATSGQWQQATGLADSTFHRARRRLLRDGYAQKAQGSSRYVASGKAGEIVIPTN